MVKRLEQGEGGIPPCLWGEAKREVRLAYYSENQRQGIWWKSGVSAAALMVAAGLPMGALAQSPVPDGSYGGSQPADAQPQNIRPQNSREATVPQATDSVEGEASGAVDEPIITDEEFDASIPPIDPDAPMGSVAEWQAQADAASADGDAAAAADAAADAASAGLDDPVAIDAAIDEPLVPLESFDVEAFDESRYTEADDSQSAEARYSYRIEGLDALSERDRVGPVDAGDIIAQFRELSALEEGDGKASNGAMVNARLQQDQKLLLDILSGQGFFDATVRGSLQLPEQGDGAAENGARNGQGRITVLIEATPGPRYRLGAIRFDAPPITPPDLIERSFRPKSGEPIIAERILGAEANIAVRLPENGYPFVEIGERDILLDPATRTPAIIPCR